jgi:hypothetical protein
MTPIEPFHVMTPYGPATCIGVLSHLEDVEWATFNNATQEMWFWTNPYIRRRINSTNGFSAYSPFTRLNPDSSRQHQALHRQRMAAAGLRSR